MKNFFFPILLSLLAFFVSHEARAQWVPMYSYQFKGVKADTLLIPTGNGAPAYSIPRHRRFALYGDSTTGDVWKYNHVTDVWSLFVGGGGALSGVTGTDNYGFSPIITPGVGTSDIQVKTLLTLGSVPFIGTDGALRENNPKFFWDSSNARLGIGMKAPRVSEEIDGHLYVADTITTSNNLNNDRLAQFFNSVTSAHADTSYFPRAFFAQLTTAGATNFIGNPDATSGVVAGEGQVMLDADITVARSVGINGKSIASGNDSVTHMIGVQGGITALAGVTVRVQDAIGVAGSTFQEAGTIVADSFAYFKTFDNYVVDGAPSWTENITNKFGLFIHDYTPGGGTDWGIYQAGLTKQNTFEGATFFIPSDGTNTSSVSIAGPAIELLTADVGGSNCLQSMLPSGDFTLTGTDDTGLKFAQLELEGATGRLGLVSSEGIFILDGALPTFANNAAALGGGLTAGMLYRNGDVLQIVH